MSQAGSYVVGGSAMPILTLTGNVGGPVSPDGLGNIDILGTGDVTVTGTPNTLTISLSGDVANTFEGNTGAGAVPALGILFIEGAAASVITTNAAASTVSINLTASTNGQLIIGAPAGAVWANLTSTGGTITVTNGANTINLETSFSTLFPWTVTTVSATMVANNGYIANNAGTLTMTLPAVAAVGAVFRITGINNATGWRIAQQAGQIIYFGASTTTLGVGGSLTSSATRNAIELVCVVANTDFQVISSIGNITVV